MSAAQRRGTAGKGRARAILAALSLLYAALIWAMARWRFGNMPFRALFAAVARDALPRQRDPEFSQPKFEQVLASAQRSGSYRQAVWGYRLIFLTPVVCCCGIPWWMDAVPALVVTPFLLPVLGLILTIRLRSAADEWTPVGGRVLRAAYREALFYKPERG